jgi:large subunit ribosomal protein L29
MKTSELRKQTVEELNESLTQLLEEQFKMRMQNATGQIVRPHRFKQVRREIARFNTIIHEKQGE